MLGSLNNQPITIYFGGGYLEPVCCQDLRKRQIVILTLSLINTTRNHCRNAKSDYS
jgi:hypothetical protein